MSSSRVSQPFTITSSNNTLRVAIDEASGSSATITLPTTSSPNSGEDIAKSIEAQIRALASTGGAKAGNFSYLNAKVSYVDGRFIIVSGRVSSYLTGSSRSSVQVLAGTSNDASTTLGFDIPIESVTLAGTAIEETYVTAVVSSSTTVPVATVVNINAGDVVAFKESTGTITYRYVDSVSAPNIIVNTSISLEENAMVQVLRMQDPLLGPSSYYQDIDSCMRHAIELIARQINFAS